VHGRPQVWTGCPRSHVHAQYRYRSSQRLSVRSHRCRTREATIGTRRREEDGGLPGSAAALTNAGPMAMMHVGQLVSIHGLTSRADLNGLDARVVGTSRAGRIAVLPHGTMDPVAIRLHKLQTIDWLDRIPNEVVRAIMSKMLMLCDFTALSMCNRRLRDIRPSLVAKCKQLTFKSIIDLTLGVAARLDLFHAELTRRSTGRAMNSGYSHEMEYDRKWLDRGIVDFAGLKRACAALGAACAFTISVEKVEYTDSFKLLAQQAAAALEATLLRNQVEPIGANEVHPHAIPTPVPILVAPTISALANLIALYDPEMRPAGTMGPLGDQSRGRRMLAFVDDAMGDAVHRRDQEVLRAGCRYYAALAGLRCHKHVAKSFALYQSRSNHPADVARARPLLRHAVARPEGIPIHCDMCNDSLIEVQEMLARATDCIHQVHQAMVTFPSDEKIIMWGCRFLRHMAAYNMPGGATNVVWGGGMFTDWRRGIGGTITQEVSGLQEIEIGNLIVESMEPHFGNAAVQQSALQALLELDGTAELQDEYFPWIVTSMHSHRAQEPILRLGKRLLKCTEWKDQLDNCSYDDKLLAPCNFEDDAALREWVEIALA